jgi:hypothetical protein
MIYQLLSWMYDTPADASSSQPDMSGNQKVCCPEPGCDGCPHSFSLHQAEEENLKLADIERSEAEKQDLIAKPIVLTKKKRNRKRRGFSLTEFLRLEDSRE